MKLMQVQKFIDKGNKVKVTIQMRGRENSKSSEVLDFFNSQISEYLSSFKYDLPLKTNGNRIIGIVIKND
jgi:translation initiation factor IF-3